ncbi:unnamed protein product [Paramecium sonneborni]|uniref:Uncharacterized protein n=1 Tax=Paramecium sonneborni TaxID=65129 RepID=A0A8S1RHN3_9CILI|nr:unnamed protein product [Paramecium sonneborni]
MCSNDLCQCCISCQLKRLRLRLLDVIIMQKCNKSFFTCPASFSANLDLNADTKNAKYSKVIVKQIQLVQLVKPQLANAGCALEIGFGKQWTAANFDGVGLTTDTFCVTQSTLDKLKFCIKKDATACQPGTCEDIPSPANKQIMICIQSNFILQIKILRQQ